MAGQLTDFFKGSKGPFWPFTKMTPKTAPRTDGQGANEAL